MIGCFIRMIVSRRRRKDAVARAVHHFEEQCDKPALLGHVIHADAVRCVVRVCYKQKQNVKPPSRVWYSVADNGEIAELTFDEVRQFGELFWR